MGEIRKQELEIDLHGSPSTFVDGSIEATAVSSERSRVRAIGYENSEQPSPSLRADDFVPAMTRDCLRSCAHDGEATLVGAAPVPRFVEHHEGIGFARVAASTAFDASNLGAKWWVLGVGYS